MPPSTLSSLVRRGVDFLTPNASSSTLASGANAGGFATAPEGALFPTVDPAVDGEDCDRDCDSCAIRYPAKFSIDESAKLYGHVKGWATHMIVATGKSDWVRDVADERGSVMQAVGRSAVQPENGRLMLSASDMPVPQTAAGYPRDAQPTTVLLLPSFTVVEHVTPQSVPDLIAQLVSPGPTNTTLLPPRRPLSAAGSQPAADAAATATPPPTAFRTHPSPHAALILLCSQKTRDARCGQSAPLLRREFERQLRPLGLYRDAHDDRPGGVRVIFISHVGGHKFSANVIVYRKAAAFGAADGAVGQEAGQCIWLARVRPADCEGIVQFTVLQGKVVKPERQLRGGFDREKGLVSW